jgi:hypothetical protein
MQEGDFNWPAENNFWQLYENQFGSLQDWGYQDLTLTNDFIINPQQQPQPQFTVQDEMFNYLSEIQANIQPVSDFLASVKPVRTPSNSKLSVNNTQNKMIMITPNTDTSSLPSTSPITADSSLKPYVPQLPHNAFHRVILNNGKALYKCTAVDCGKTFTRKAENAKSHWMSHNQIAPFICEWCVMGFRRMADLKRHCRKNHGGKVCK